MEEDFTKKCRACLNEDPEMHNLFAELDQDLTLAEILKSLNLEVIENDGFPTYMCQSCTIIVIDFFNLKTIYSENEQHMRNLVEKQAESEDVEIDLNAVIVEENKELIIKEDHENNEEPITFVVQEVEESELYDVTFKCSLCDKLFEESHTYNEHMIEKHNTFDKSNEKQYKKEPNSKKPWICDVCGGRFKRKSDLLDHSEAHSNEKKYVCPYCGKGFKRRTVLVKHVKLHTHPREAICELCGRAFNDKGTLKTHIMLIHEKSRNFKCNLCGQSFPLKSTLDKHLFRHNPNRKRNFVCELCYTAYRDKSSLNRHMAVKHTNKKYKCECGKEYSTLTNLFKHKKKHHIKQILVRVEVPDEIQDSQ